MAKRVAIRSNGIWIAKPGLSVDTADEADLLFSPLGSIQGVYMTGTVVTAPVTMPTTPSGAGSNRYRYAEVMFGKTFSQAPMVHVVGIDAANARRDVCTLTTRVTSVNVFHEPNYVVYSQVDRFKLWTKALLQANWSLNLTDWRYFVMENGL